MKCFCAFILIFLIFGCNNYKPNVNKLIINDSAQSLFDIALKFEKLNFIDSAEKYFSKSLSLLDRNTFTNQLAKNYISLAYCNFSKSDYLFSKIYYDSAFYVYSNLKENIDSLKYAWDLFNYGYYHHYLSVYSEAEKYYSKAFKIFSALKGQYEMTYKLSFYQSYIYCYLKEFNQAFSKINTSIDYYLSKNDTSTLIELYTGKAYFFYARKEYINSLEYYKKALDLIRKDDLYILNRIARCYYNLNCYDSSQVYFKKCKYLINSNSEITTQVTFYGEYSQLLSAIGKKKEALSMLIQKLSFFQSNKNVTRNQYSYFLYRIAQSYESINDINSALEYFHKSLNQSLDIDSLKTSFSTFEIPVYKNVYSYETAIDALISKGDILLKFNNFKSAFLHYKKAKELSEIFNKSMTFENDRLLYSSSSEDLFNKLLTTTFCLYYQTGNKYFIEEAFRISDNFKASQLTYDLNNSQLKKSCDVPDSILEKEKDLLKKISIYQNSQNSQSRLKYVSAADEYKNLNNYIEEHYIKFKKLKYSQINANVSELKKSLHDKECIIEYSFSRDSLYSFIITSNSFEFHVQNSKGLADSIYELRKVIEDNTHSRKNFNSFCSLSYFLYKRLFERLKDYTDNFIIIPDGPICHLPFELLIDTPSKKTYEYRLLNYLVKKYAFTYCYSSNIFLKINSSVFNPSDVYAFAPVNFKNPNLDLPYSEKEVENILDIYPGKSFLHKKATKNNFLKILNKGKVIHLAIHGANDINNDLNSYLLFYSDTLTSSEIYNLNINSPLIVLSACNTYIGSLIKGEGIMSLSRSFIYAGARRLIVTHWPVTDNCSAEIMKSFYTYLKQNNSISISLRKAKQDFISSSDNKYSFPYYWAEYSFIGR